MKNTFKTIILLGLACFSLAVTAQTKNVINLEALATGSEGDTRYVDESTLKIDSVGMTNYHNSNEFDDWSVSASMVTYEGALGHTFKILFGGIDSVDMTEGDNYGAMLTPGAIDRSSAGDMGVRSGPDGGGGIGNGQGMWFGLDLTNIDSTCSVQIMKVRLSTLSSDNRKGVLVNRHQTDKSFSFGKNGVGADYETGSSKPEIDLAALGLILQGGQRDSAMLSVFSTTLNNEAFRIINIEVKFIATPEITNNEVSFLPLPYGVEGSGVTVSESEISIGADGHMVTSGDLISWDWRTSGVTDISSAFDKSFSVVMSAMNTVDQNEGDDFGKLLTTTTIDRSSDGQLGVNGAGIKTGQGYQLGLDLSNLSSSTQLTLLEVMLINLNGDEECMIVNRKATAERLVVSGDSLPPADTILNDGNLESLIDVSSLNISMYGGSRDLDIASFFLSNDTTTGNYRICGLKFQISDATVSGIDAISNEAEKTFKLVSNPFDEVLRIQNLSNVSKNVEVRLYNVAGQLVLDQKVMLDSNVFSLDTQALLSGVYLCTITDGGEVMTSKVIKR